MEYFMKLIISQLLTFKNLWGNFYFVENYILYKFKKVEFRNMLLVNSLIHEKKEHKIYLVKSLYLDLVLVIS